MIMKTLHILVSCCLDPTRTQQLQETVDSLQDIDQNYLIVIDNGSTDPGADVILARLKNVIRLQKNYGYWSAVNYGLTFLESNTPYVYVIESDMVHYDYKKIFNAEKFLDETLNVGSVRLQEFSVAEQHLYDKNKPLPESRRWAWTRLSNHFTGIISTFVTGKYGCFWTNLAPQVPALNRASFMRKVFKELSAAESINEADFQKCYFREYVSTAVLDGGIYNCKSSYEKAITGSYTDPKILTEIGYRPTRIDTITSTEKIILKS